jgi:hypothetical protein
MRYLVRERLFSITDDFWVTDEQGSKVFLVDGKALRLRETFELKDVSGRKLATIHKRFLTFTDAMEIEHDGAVVVPGPRHLRRRRRPGRERRSHHLHRDLPGPHSPRRRTPALSAVMPRGPGSLAEARAWAAAQISGYPIADLRHRVVLPRTRGPGRPAPAG